MKENFTEDNNFEMRNYKFNPTFTEKDKKPNPNKFINSDKLTTNKRFSKFIWKIKKRNFTSSIFYLEK